jgi:transposase
MGYIGGSLQEAFVERIRGVDRERLLAVPIDVGKRTAAALVCDFYGQLVVAPFSFGLDERGLELFVRAVATAEAERGSAWVRVGLESAGHYHQTLLARLRDLAFDVSVLNPAQVKGNRAQDLLRSLKTDERDLGAMAELLIRGKGRPVGHVDEAMATQAAICAHRRRKVKARTAVKNHVHKGLDLVFPGLSGCFDDILGTKVGRLLLTEGMDPSRVRRLGPERLRGFCRHRGGGAPPCQGRPGRGGRQEAFALPEAIAATHAGVLRSDVALLAYLDREIAAAEQALAEVLPHTPAAVLTTMPRVAVVRASAYGAALGDPTRFTNPGQVYRLSGLVPRLCESAGRRRAGTRISREGKAELREAILDLGKALRQGHPNFARYAGDLEARASVRAWSRAPSGTGRTGWRSRWCVTRCRSTRIAGGDEMADGRVMAERARPCSTSLVHQGKPATRGRPRGSRRRRRSRDRRRDRYGAFGTPPPSMTPDPSSSGSTHVVAWATASR